MPLCLLASFAVLWLFGFSINLLTLLAMVLAIGIVVDDAIVVLENVYHRIEEGEPPLAAAFEGTRQVGFAIVSTTLVVCAVFVPIMFIAGQTGLLFRELAAAMIGAVAFSGFLALSLAPMLCSKLLRHEERGPLRRAGSTTASAGSRASMRGRLDGVIRRPLVPLVVVGALPRRRRRRCSRPSQSELVPAEDVGILSANVSAPEGTGFAQMDRYMLDAQGKLLPLDRARARSARSSPRTPGGFGASDDFNSGTFVVFLKPWEEREKTTQDVVQEVNRRLGQIPAVRGNAQVRSSLGGRGRGQPISFVIAGATYDELARARDRILAAAAANPGIVNLDSDYKETKPQLRIAVDTARAGDLGVSVDDVSQALQTLLGSRRVSTYIDRGEEYRVIVQAEAGDARDRGRSRSPSTSAAAPARWSRSSNLVTVTRHGRRARPRPLQQAARDHPLGRPRARLFARRGARPSSRTQAGQSPEVIAVGYRGESQAFREAGGSIWLVFVLTILIVYLLLAAQFESFVHPGRDHHHRAAGGRRRRDRPRRHGPDAQPLQPGRHRHAGRPRRQERHPDRRVRQPAARPGPRHRPGDPRGLGAPAAADPDDLDRHRRRRGAADAGERRRRRGAHRDRRRHRLRASRSRP